jgi:hypothetical protein
MSAGQYSFRRDGRVPVRFRLQWRVERTLFVCAIQYLSKVFAEALITARQSKQEILPIGWAEVIPNSIETPRLKVRVTGNISRFAVSCHPFVVELA